MPFLERRLSIESLVFLGAGLLFGRLSLFVGTQRLTVGEGLTGSSCELCEGCGLCERRELCEGCGLCERRELCEGCEGGERGYDVWGRPSFIFSYGCGALTCS